MFVEQNKWSLLEGSCARHYVGLSQFADHAMKEIESLMQVASSCRGVGSISWLAAAAASCCACTYIGGTYNVLYLRYIRR